MMMMKCFCDMVDWWNAFSLISSWNHCQRSSSLWILNKSWAVFKPAQNVSSGFNEWSCAVVITIPSRRHKTLRLPVHSFTLIKNGYHLSSTGFIWVRVGLTMHGTSFKNEHSVRKDSLKVNNTINRLNITLYYSLSLNTCKCYYVTFINRVVIDWKIKHIHTHLFNTAC